MSGRSGLTSGKTHMNVFGYQTTNDKNEQNSCFVHNEKPMLIIQDTSLLGQGFGFEPDWGRGVGSRVRAGVVCITLARPTLEKILVVVDSVCKSQTQENKTTILEQLTTTFVCILNRRDDDRYVFFQSLVNVVGD